MDIEILEELRKIVTKNKVKEIRTLRRCSCRNADKIDSLYEMMDGSDSLAEEEIAKNLGFDGTKARGYQNCKRALFARLIASLHFIDRSKSKFNNHQKAYYEAELMLKSAIILEARYSKKATLYLLTKTLNLAKKYEITRVSRDTSFLLKNYYGNKTGNHKKWAFFKKEHERYQIDLFHEEYAIDCGNELSLFMGNTASRPSTAFREKCERQISSLHERECDTFRFILNSSIFEIRFYVAAGKFEQVYDVTEHAINRLVKKKFVGRNFLSALYVWQLVASIHLLKYQKGADAYRKGINIVEKGTTDWYNLQDLYKRLLLRKGEIKRAHPVYQETLTQDNFKHQTQKRRHIYRQYGALFSYFKMKGQLSTETGKTFRLRKFLNEIPIFSQDKRGYNITVLIIQILILLEQKKYDQLTDRIEAIEKYTSRYLRNDENFRSNCFIKMLLQIPKRNFHRVAVLRHAKPYIKRLATVPLEESKQSYEIEIIPYEHLWEYALESLR